MELGYTLSGESGMVPESMTFQLSPEGLERFRQGREEVEGTHVWMKTLIWEGATAQGSGTKRWPMQLQLGNWDTDANLGKDQGLQDLWAILRCLDYTRMENL